MQDLLFRDGMTCWPASKGLPDLARQRGMVDSRGRPRDGVTEGNACKTPMDLLFKMA